MTPEEFLSELQQEYAAQPLLLMVASAMYEYKNTNLFDTPSYRKVLKLYGLDPDSTKEAILQAIADYRLHAINTLHSNIISSLPENTRELLRSKGPFAVGVLEYSQFNASAIPVPGGNGFVLVFREGLGKILSYSSMLLLGMTDSKTLALTPILDFISGSKAFVDMLHYHYSLGLHPPDARADFGEDVEKWTRLIAHISEVFVHCHELAHVLLGHLEQGEVQALPNTDGTVNELISSHEAEFEADKLGLELTFATVSKTMEMSPAAVAHLWAGVWLFIQVAGIFESFDPQAQGTHPPANKRVELLEALVKTKCADLGFDHRCMYWIAGPMSRSVMTAFKNFEFELIPLLRSPLEKFLEETLAQEDGLIKFTAQLYIWLADTALPRKFCEEIGRVRSKSLAIALKASLDLRKLSKEEVLEIADKQTDHSLKWALHKWFALDLKLDSSQAGYPTPLFEDYILRTAKSTEHHLERLLRGER